jgi:hypothetical protein
LSVDCGKAIEGVLKIVLMFECGIGIGILRSLRKYAGTLVGLLCKKIGPEFRSMTNGFRFDRRYARSMAGRIFIWQIIYNRLLYAMGLTLGPL